mgnify:FL=1
MAKKPSMSATEAKKKAMANRGTFDASGTSLGRPYHHLTLAAVKPYVKASADSCAIWADTLTACVPPAFSLRYAELKAQLTEAMAADEYQKAAEIAASLVKALAVMDTTARSAGHMPPAIDGLLVEWGDKVYCILASGDIGAVRRDHGSWTVYHASDVAALLSGRASGIMAAVVNAFPDAKITHVGPMIEDAIDL